MNLDAIRALRCKRNSDCHELLVPYGNCSRSHGGLFEGIDYIQDFHFAAGGTSWRSLGGPTAPVPEGRRPWDRYFSTRNAWRGAVRTMALRARRSFVAMKSRANSLRTNLMNASICDCISPILSRMLRMISMPARLTPSSRV